MTIKRPKRHLLTYVWTLPAALITWLIVLIIWLLWGTKLHWLEGLWCEFDPDSWPARTWYKGWGGTTLVQGGWFAPERSGEVDVIDTRVEAHEHIHIEQAQAAALLGFITALAILLTGGSAVLALCVWTATPLLAYLTAGVQAVIRGESFYKGNHLEEHAYDSDDLELERHKNEK